MRPDCSWSYLVAARQRADVTQVQVPEVTADRLDLAASRIDHHVRQGGRRALQYSADPRPIRSAIHQGAMRTRQLTIHRHEERS
jgi:hypothetical protein